MVEGKLPRGFKADCQRRALELRLDLGLNKIDPLNSFDLARHLTIECQPHSEICGQMDIYEKLNCSYWSAILLRLNTKSLIIYNDSHSEARHQSSVMHEIAHYILEHTAPPISSQIPLFYIDHSPQQELEANTLSSILLLPRIIIEHCAKTKKKIDEMSAQYGISSALIKKEINMCGILKQYKDWYPYN